MKIFNTSSLLVILLATVTQCVAQNSSASSASLYTHFDLFKNTELQPCPANNKTSFGTSKRRLAYSTEGKAKSPDDYCKYMVGTPVVIPTRPTSAAYYPTWPSFATQLISLAFTYLGLWLTLRKLNKNQEKHDMTLPKTFWIQLPIDIARILAWYISFFRGLADMSQFPWVSTVIWTVPFNYIWLLLLLQGEGIESQLAARAPARKRLRIIIGVVIFITVIQWLASLGACIIHYKYTWGSFRTKMYTELQEAIANPGSLGDLPKQCSDFLASPGLPEEFFSSLTTIKAFATQTIQFAVTTISAIAGINVVRKNSYRRTYTMLRNSAGATQSCLMFSALGLLGYAFGGTKNVTMYVTNDQTITGPCTFAVVALWDIWGFYDIQYGRALRMVLNVLGV